MTKGKSVIVIGSGIGGLTVGNLLSQKGYEVTIFESHSKPGGYIGGFYQKGFYFESGTISFNGRDLIFEIMKKLGVLEKIRFVNQKIRIMAQDFDFILEDSSSFENELCRFFPGELNNIKKLFSTLKSVVDNKTGIINSPSEYQDKTVVDISKLFFREDSRMHALLTNLGYPEMGVLGIALFLQRSFYNCFSVYGGMQSWANILADNFRKLGGKIRLSSYVNKIIVEDNKAIAVESNGIVSKGDYVISACDYKKTFLELLDNIKFIPVDFIDCVKKSLVSEGFFAVYLGLSLPNKALRKYMRVPVLEWLGQELEANFCNLNTEYADFFKRCKFALYSPSLVNPHLAPDGKSSLIIGSICPHDWMGNWASTQGEYKILKERVKNTLIERASNIIPDLREFIEYDDAATPLTYEKYTGNSKGSSSGWRWSPNNPYYDKEKIKVETPIKNLYMSSAWVSKIGGVYSAIWAAILSAARISQE